MKERPILMQAPMVLAYLAGKKNQTRRIANPQPSCCHWERHAGYRLLVGEVKNCSTGKAFVNFRHSLANRFPGSHPHLSENESSCCQQGMVGDALYVREHHARIKGMKGMHQVHYFADGPMPTIEERHDAGLLKSYPSIHMPRWASRITLPITGLRIERLQDISAEDARNEGLSCITKDGSLFKYGIPDRDGLPGTDDYGWPWKEWETDPVQVFRKLWEKIYGVGSWDLNPFVWVIEFPPFAATSQPASK